MAAPVQYRYGDSVDQRLEQSTLAVAGAALWAMTDAMYGIGGSFAQLALFSVVVWVWLPLMVVAPIGHFLLPVSAKPVYLVNR